MIRKWRVPGIVLAALVAASSSAGAQVSNGAAIGIVLANAARGNGVQILRVLPNSPAERARIIPGDTITMLGSINVTSVLEFQSLMNGVVPGSLVEVTVDRAGTVLHARVDTAYRSQMMGTGSACDAQGAGEDLARARDAVRRRDGAIATLDAERARNRYDACAISALPSLYYGFVMNDADAQLLQAAGYAGRGKRAIAASVAAQARAYLQAIASGETATAAQRALATRKIEIIDRTFASLSNVSLGEAIVPRMAKASDDSTASPFSVLASWTSPGNADLQVLHIRVNLHPSQATNFSGNMFRIRTTSPTAGTETAYGLTVQAPSYQRVDWGSSAPNATITKPDVDPSEDLGYLHALALNAGDARTVVISFIVRSDADVSGAVQTLQLVTP
ncbi:MAG: PDZ domain-containing protein [bacterium]|nr:PDZ domain-containing protein [bacterium]